MTTEGTSIFKEMVQNADDAGATEVNFCLDYREHGSERLAYTKLQPFQGMHPREQAKIVLSVKRPMR